MFRKSITSRINGHQKALELTAELLKSVLEQQNRNTAQATRRIESQDALWDSIERITKHLEATQKYHQQVQDRLELIEYRHQAYLDSKKGNK